MNQWTTRLEIGFEALFAAVAAGLLILLIALTLIMLKLGFLLLLVAGPFFLIIGIHPGFGRVVAIRWFEMLVGVLMKQVAVALTLSILLYCYSLIMGTTDQVLPWALKIMMIALVTVTVFIYRKPFQHLFSSVGYGMLGAEERAQVSWRESAFGFRRVTASAAGVAVPGMGGPARVALGAARHGGRRRGGDGTAADAGGVAAAGATVPEGMSAAPVADSHVTGRQWPDAGVGTGSRTAAPPLPLSPHGSPPASGPSAGWARSGAAGTGTGARQARAAAGTPERRAARGPPGRSARADVTPHDRKRWPGGSQPNPFWILEWSGRGSGKASRDTVLGAVAPPVQVRGSVMELTPGRQRLVFVVVVLALAGLGIYLLHGRGSRRHASRRPVHVRERRPQPSASAASAAGVPPSSVPAATPASTAGGAEIYQWLPFTPADLTAAAQTTVSFAKDYATWSYTENATAYGAKLNGLATPQEMTALEKGYSTPGVAQQRTADKQVSTGSGTIDSISSFGSSPTSITFLVTITQQVTSTQPTTTARPPVRRHGRLVRRRLAGQRHRAVRG